MPTPGADFNAAFNSQIRSAGNRSRTTGPLPDIGQNAPMPPPGGFNGQPVQPATPTPAGPPANQGMMASPMRAPTVQPSTFTVHPPGSPADANQYNYEPQPDGSWRVYPPGVAAPAHTASASLPRAASTGDYMRLSRAFGTANPNQPAPRPPTG